MKDNARDTYIKNFVHTTEEYPVLSQQTHFVFRDGKVVSEKIGINENIMHYIQDTALLISVIDGSVDSENISSAAYDHIVYLDKSARPVSWLVNLLWTSFAAVDNKGNQARRPSHTYVNIDRSPWFRNVGINVSNDGRQKNNGELATFYDFLSHKGNLTNKHLAAIRSLFISGGIDTEDPDVIMRTPTILDGKRLLIVDEVSRTGSTLQIAKYLFKEAIPEIAYVEGEYFWHPGEPLIKVGNEYMLTSIPVWYDPVTSIGRGIGELNADYYRNRYNHYRKQAKTDNRYDLKKLRTQAFAASVLSAPLLKPDGSTLSLKEEKISRNLAKDLCRLADDYTNGKIFFTPPAQWSITRIEAAIRKQGAILIPEHASEYEARIIRESNRFYLKVIQAIRKYDH